MAGMAEAFAHFGAVPRNRRWSWSARSPDGHTVVWRYRVTASGGKTGRSLTMEASRIKNIWEASSERASV